LILKQEQKVDKKPQFAMLFAYQKEVSNVILRKFENTASHTKRIIR